MAFNKSNVTHTNRKKVQVGDLTARGLEFDKWPAKCDPYGLIECRFHLLFAMKVNATIGQE